MWTKDMSDNLRFVAPTNAAEARAVLNTMQNGAYGGLFDALMLMGAKWDWAYMYTLSVGCKDVSPEMTAQYDALVAKWADDNDR